MGCIKPIEVEHFIKNTCGDLIVLRHPSLNGKVEWNQSTDTVPMLFQRIKEFAGKNNVLLGPELAKVCNSFERDVEEIKREMEGFDYEEDFF